jgi:hypothetical protein
MKATIDLPDDLLHAARARAAEEGISLSRWVTDALERKFREASTAREPPSKDRRTRKQSPIR